MVKSLKIVQRRYCIVSIINEALKKTQQSRKSEKEKRTQAKMKATTTLPPTQNAVPVSVKKQPDPMTKSDFMFILKATCFLTVTGLLVVMALTQYQHLFTHKSHPTAMMQRVVASKPPIANKIRVAFEGVFLSDTHNAALINKQMMQVGDMLNGMKIIAISPDTVDLQSNNGAIRLKAGATYLL